MTIVKWAPITETDRIPPLGGALEAHIGEYRGAVRHDSCSAWGLLYRVLTENGLPLGTVVFDGNGKPRFDGGALFFSISHGKGVCAVAVADRPVGVDVEHCRAQYNSRMVERSLCAAEKETFDGDFTRIWCRKEAVAKMTGKGISGYPNGIDTTGIPFIEEKISYGDRDYWLVAVTETGNE